MTPQQSRSDDGPIGDYLAELGMDEASEEEYKRREGETTSRFRPFRTVRIKKSAIERGVGPRSATQIHDGLANTLPEAETADS